MKSLNTATDENINKIKQILGNKSLATELEMIVKHLPTYDKIIKTHIAQLQNVLALDNHQNKNLENINISPIIKQLINIFEQLTDQELKTLQELYMNANTWQTDTSTVLDTTMVSEATL